MDPELIKQLEGAGFKMKDAILNCTCGQKHYAPSLEELIEACGDRELNIIKKLSEIDHKYKWRAGVTWQDIDGYGPTPIEAVARLWLELHKK